MEDIELSEITSTYARARGADRISFFGDWVAISDIQDFTYCNNFK